MEIIIPVAKIIAGLVAVVIVCVMVSAVINTRKLRSRDEALALGGLSATARIRSFRRKFASDNRISPIIIELTFTSADGQPVSSRMELDLVSPVFAGKYAPGSEVMVTYNPAQPEQFLIAEPDIVRQY
ncbi:hypothetical protein GCM10022198_06380 [Klugiella xanthotipulae]|uniref:Uncharacterized protein DUF3592 n=1 Tax=Klugiella xanthotipulae TaxID=244735 RepID=A0A543I5Y1_9MICO|nr:DUF3592 domain-containing protein [Klugiella xanthotipulae]TQM66005.1 uncharacterized protein DUF3592 [Klugiella xanthotipulae]